MAIVFETQEEFERAVMDVIMKRVGLTAITESVWVQDFNGEDQRVIQDIEVIAFDRVIDD